MTAPASPTPKSSAAELAAGTSVTLAFPSGDLAGHLTIAPGRVGHNSVVLVLTHKDGAAPAEVKSVRVLLRSPALGIYRLDVPGSLTESGTWRAEDVTVPAAGSWTVSVEVRISDFVQARSSAELSIP
jgi:copper transport protein